MKINIKWTYIQSKRNWNIKKTKKEWIYDIVCFQYKYPFQYYYFFSSAIYSIRISLIFGLFIFLFSYLFKESFFLFFQKDYVFVYVKTIQLWYWKHLYWMILLKIMMAIFLLFLLSKSLFHLFFNSVKKNYNRKRVLFLSYIHEYVKLKTSFLNFISSVMILPFLIEFHGFIILFACFLSKWFYYFTFINAIALTSFCYYEFIYFIGLRKEILNDLYLSCFRIFTKSRRQKWYRKNKRY